jgi:hypothetical protein
MPYIIMASKLPVVNLNIYLISPMTLQTGVSDSHEQDSVIIIV